MRLLQVNGPHLPLRGAEESCICRVLSPGTGPSLELALELLPRTCWLPRGRFGQRWPWATVLVLCHVIQDLACLLQYGGLTSSLSMPFPVLPRFAPTPPPNPLYPRLQVHGHSLLFVL